jgi:hypothetical protein
MLGSKRGGRESLFFFFLDLTCKNEEFFREGEEKGYVSALSPNMPAAASGGRATGRKATVPLHALTQACGTHVVKYRQQRQ